MNTVKVRNLELGNGIPAICIPNVGRQKKTFFLLPVPTLTCIWI